MIKQVPYLGLVSKSSDYECQDGEIAAAGNILTDERGLITASDPVSVKRFSSGDKPLYIHEPPSSTDGGYYIYQSGTTLKASPIDGGSDLTVGTGITDIQDTTSIGNILVVLADGVRHNYIWKKGDGSSATYTEIPSNLRINLQFALNGTRYNKTIDNALNTETYNSQTIIKRDEASVNSVMGIVNERRNKVREDNRFVEPFFVRYGLRMYDGVIVYASAPILMVPNSDIPILIRKQSNSKTAYTTIVGCDLMYKFINDDDFGIVKSLADIGIISSVVIAASSPIVKTDLNYKYKEDNILYLNDDHLHYDNIYGLIANGQKAAGTPASVDVQTVLMKVELQTQANESGGTCVDLPRLAEDTVLKSMELNSSVQFVIHEIPASDINIPNPNNFSVIKLEEGTVANIEAKTVFDVSDVTYNNIYGTSLYSYNGRLNISDITETLFHGWNIADNVGFTNELTYDTRGVTPVNGKVYTGDYSQIKPGSLKYRVEIEGSFGDKVIKYSIPYGRNTFAPTSWFYLPFEATRITIYRVALYVSQTTEYLVQERVITMNKHSILNGSFYAEYSMNSDYNLDKGWKNIISRTGQYDPRVEREVGYYNGTTTDPDAGKVFISHSPNLIIQSEANNPFAFKATGRITVGNDRIIRMAANTRAISEGQFGAYPLYAFTENGVYSLSLSNTGEYISCQPSTRDVVLGNGESICQTDNAILFAAQRGIMELQGNNARCISLDVDGKLLTDSLIENELVQSVFADIDSETVTPFSEYLIGCRIIYDYKSQRYIVFNPATAEGDRKYGYAYAYSLKTGTWGTIPCSYTDTINSYPKAYAVDWETIVDVSQVSDNEHEHVPLSRPPRYEPRLHEGWFLTRPISLGAPNDFKIIDYVRQDGVFSSLEQTSVPSGITYDGESKNIYDYAVANGAFTNTNIIQVLWGSNDLQTWHVIASSQSHRISDFIGSPFKWFRLAVRCSLYPRQSVSSVTFSYRIKSQNNKLL